MFVFVISVIVLPSKKIYYYISDYLTTKCICNLNNNKDNNIDTKSCLSGGYHDSKERRRNPYNHSYLNIPCPTVYINGIWHDPSNCVNFDNCKHCHTFSEFIYHPGISFCFFLFFFIFIYQCVQS